MLDELRTRAHVALGQLPEAQKAYYTFTGCMAPTDEPVRQELEAAVEEVARTWVPPEPVLPPAPVIPVEPLPEPRAWTGRALMGGGALAALGSGTASALTWRRGQQLLSEGERDAYERTRTANHAVTLLALAGGGTAALGLGVEVLNGRVVLGPTGLHGRLP